MIDIIQLPALENNYIYIVHDRLSDETAVIDPAIAAPVLEVLQQNDWSLKNILNTHHHEDHIGANIELKQKTACKIAASSIDQYSIPEVDITLTEGQQLYLGSLTINIISTPGHTLGHIVYYIPETNSLFCGDTLFAMGCGRLFEGTPEQLWQSLQKLKKLPESTLIYCAHEYTVTNGHFALSVDPENELLQQRMLTVTNLRNQNLPTIPMRMSEELATNPFLRTHSPSIQKTLNMEGKSEIEIFTTLRHLKNTF